MEESQEWGDNDISFYLWYAYKLNSTAQLSYVHFIWDRWRDGVRERRKKDINMSLLFFSSLESTRHHILLGDGGYSSFIHSFMN